MTDSRSKTLRETIQTAEAFLAERGVDSPRLSAEVLCGHALGLDRTGLVVKAGDVLSPEDAEAVEALVRRRAVGEPVAYITGVREFYGLDFAVSPAVLIPRPETEHLVEAVLERFGPGEMIEFADFGTGSGILAVTVAKLLSASRGTAVDRSPEALAVARANAEHHGVADRLTFLEGDFTAPLLPDASLDLLVSNPPYVSGPELETCSGEVVDFEPHAALYSADDGLAHTRGLLPRAAAALRPGGMLALEFGWRQGPAVLDLLGAPDSGFTAASLGCDLAGHDRFVTARRNGK